MPINGHLFSPLVSPAVNFRGHGYFAGEPPDVAEEPPDGRARKLNVPGIVRVNVYERGSMRLVASTLSAADGTWRIEYINADLVYTVIGFDDSGALNASIQDWVKPAPMV